MVRSVKRNDDSAEIGVDVRPVNADPDTPSSTWKVYMVHENGAWQVDMVRTGQAELGKGAPLKQRDLMRLLKGRLARQ